MSKVVATFGVGEHEQILDYTLPRIEDYARRHGYAISLGSPAMDRPPSWWKVPLLLTLLQRWDEVLWIDCDVLILDPSVDVRDEVADDSWQALIRHHTPDGEVPNCGVWFVRRDMVEVLKEIWEMDQYSQHYWWEQRAMLDLLGYSDSPCRLVDPTPLYEKTTWLPLEWNSHEQNDRHPNARFAHITPNSVQWRIERIKAYL